MRDVLLSCTHPSNTVKIFASADEKRPTDSSHPHDLGLGMHRSSGLSLQVGLLRDHGQIGCDVRIPELVLGQDLKRGPRFEDGGESVLAKYVDLIADPQWGSPRRLRNSLGVFLLSRLGIQTEDDPRPIDPVGMLGVLNR